MTTGSQGISALRRPLILVIEDDGECREAICQLLSDEGFDVQSAENGSVGLEKAMGSRSALVLCDVRMPVMNGYETLTGLRASRATADVPFVFLSAGVDLKDVRKGMNLGADDYLVKPFSAEELLETVRARLERFSREALARPEDEQEETLTQSTHNGQILERITPRYRVVARVGRSKKSSVYEARDLTWNEPVAVKFLTENASAERFDRECAILASLNHPRVVRYRERGVTNKGDQFLVMDWLSGIDLAERVRHQTLSVDEALRVLRHAAEALAVIHAAGIAHRDIKPSNIFLQGGDLDRLTLIDFGVARSADGSSITHSGDLLGTLGYLAPEQIEHAGTADARSDVFGLACTIYACFTGSSPFQGTSAMTSLFKLLFDDIPSVRALRPDVPEALDSLLISMFSRDPSLRPANGQAVLDALDAQG